MILSVITFWASIRFTPYKYVRIYSSESEKIHLTSIKLARLQKQHRLLANIGTATFRLWIWHSVLKNLIKQVIELPKNTRFYKNVFYVLQLAVNCVTQIYLLN